MSQVNLRRKALFTALSAAAFILCSPAVRAQEDFFGESQSAVKARIKAKPKAKPSATSPAKPAAKTPTAKKKVVKVPIKEVTEATFVSKNGDKRNLWNAGMGPLVPHTKFPRNCAICHVPKRWDVLRSDFSFNHLKETGYALVGAHASVSCLRCHNDRVVLSEKNRSSCTACHADPHKGTLGTTCLTCHNQTQWRAPGDQGDKVAVHSRYLFPLTGLHATIDCKQCHIKAENGDFKGLSPDCYSCHQSDFARGPSHVAQNFSHDCSGCHNTAQWPPIAGNFDHAKLPKPLVCASCHEAKYQSARPTTASNHVGNNFPQTCESCHNTSTWGPGTAMQHGTVSAFACTTCHQADYNAAPSHIALGFPADCLKCHTGTVTWANATFDHSTLGANPDCYSCHKANYAAATKTPASNHAANSFPTTCASCHNTTAFSGTVMAGNSAMHAVASAIDCYVCHTGDFKTAKPTAVSDHQANGFPTTAGACKACHLGASTNFVTWTMPAANMNHASVKTMACYACHSTNYSAASPTPASNHAVNGFPTTSPACQTCHTAAAANFATWGPGVVMQHAQVASMACYSCHKGEFTGAAPTPASKHVANQFPTTSPECQTCHVTAATNFAAWSGTTMNHTPIGGNSSQCYNCHAAEYASTSGKGGGVPDHVAAQYSHACASCHQTSIADGNWLTATGGFDHSKRLPSQMCYGCHAAHYASATKTAASNHPANGFPQDDRCQACHTLAVSGGYVSWAGTAMNHAQVSSLACASCHMANFNGAAATPSSKHQANGFPSSSPACQTCHTAAAQSFTAWSGTTMKHTVVAGVSCYNCHADDYASATKTAASNHNANAFPTTSPACQNCHTAAAATFTSWAGTTMNHSLVTAMACSNCHLADYNGATKTLASNHKANAFPLTSPACQTCHSLAVSGGYVAWGGVVMTGSIQDHAQVSSMACYSCHTAEFNASKPTPAQKHQGMFPTTSPACQTCHAAAAASFVSWNPGVMGSIGHNAVAGTSCYTCHATEFNAAKPTAASLHTGRFPTTSPACQNCHTAAASGYTTWNPGLMGVTGHQQVASLTCYTCHSAEFMSAVVTPASKHVANGFPTTGTTCQTCHTTAASSFIAWSGVRMTGSATAHAAVGGTGAACQNCHMGEYNATNNPIHSAAGYVASGCSGCHGTTTNWTTWLGAVAGHPTGASCVPTHYGASCTNCHPGNNFSFSACTCYTCHEHSPKNNPQTCGTLPTNTLCPAGCN